MMFLRKISLNHLLILVTVDFVIIMLVFGWLPILRFWTCEASWDICRKVLYECYDHDDVDDDDYYWYYFYNFNKKPMTLLLFP